MAQNAAQSYKGRRRIRTGVERTNKVNGLLVVEQCKCLLYEMRVGGCSVHLDFRDIRRRLLNHDAGQAVVVW